MANALIDWSRKVLHWCRTDPLAWSTIVTLTPLALLAAVGGLFLPWRTADLVRYAGLVLQLLGIGTVAKNLADRGVLFNLPRLRDLARRSLTTFPKWGIHATLNAAAGSATIVASGHVEASVWRGYANKSAEERIEALIANVEELKSQVTRSVAALRAEHNSLQSALTSHREERVWEDAELRRLLTGIGISSVHLDAAGIIWLSLGVVLSTIPVELAHWCRLLF